MVTRVARLSLVVLAALVLVGVGSNASAADRPLSFGVQGSYGSDDTNFAIGGRLVLDLGSQVENVEVVGTFDYFFPSVADDVDIPGIDFDVKYWEANANVIYKYPLSGSSMVPYGGVGLNYAHASASASVDLGDLGDYGMSESESDVGLNILGGVLFGTGSTKFFVEAKIEAGGGELFVVSGGIRF